jgi:hypothetical protein
VQVEVKNGWWVIHLPKLTLLLLREEFIRALQRGKAMKRAEAMAARVAPKEGPGASQ